MNIKSLFFPNYSLFLVLSLMVITATILNFLYVFPEGESLFVAFMLWEFAAIFFATLAVVIGYDYFHPAKHKSTKKIYYALAAFAMTYALISLFCTTKSILHVVQPYNIDEFLIRIEQFLHFGFLPTTIINQTLHLNNFYSFLDFTYFLWFFWMYIYASLVILDDPHAHLRERFLFCFAAVWFFIGVIAATLLASVGPIFIEDYFKRGASSDAMNTIRNSADMFEVYSEKTGLFAAFFKDIIMEYKTNETLVDMNAASAMPSVHVAIATLMMLHARHVNRAVFVASILFFACIFIGSVLLAWHYAIDGYVAALLAFGLWKLSAFLPAPEKPQNSAA